MHAKELLAELSIIKASILEQIPYPPNRLLGLDEIEDEVEFNSMVTAFSNRQYVASYLLILYEFMQEQFALYVRESHYHPGQMMPNADQALFIDKVLREEKIFWHKVSLRQSQVVHPLALLKEGQQDLSTSLLQIIREALQKLCKGLPLELEDKEMADRFVKKAALARHRVIIDKEIKVNMELLDQEELDPAIEEAIIKSNCFMVGAYIEKNKLNTALCEEYTCFALVKIFANKKIYANCNIEKISIEYPGNNGHTFLVLNRKLDSDLKDMRTWGSDAILFDPWANFLYSSSDFTKSRNVDTIYSSAFDWTIEATFNQHDVYLLHNIALLDTCFEMTGLQEERDRLPMLMDEYQLMSLEHPILSELKNFLYQLLDSVKPAKFNLPIELFITHVGNQYVSHIAGFPRLVIAIHRDFLADMDEEGEFTLEELRFALAYEIQYLYFYGSGVFNQISLEQKKSLDENAINVCGNGLAAISYFRKSHLFSKQHKPFVRLPTYRNPGDKKLSYTHRIRHLMTFIAQSSYLATPVAATFLPKSMTATLSPLQREKYFKQKFDLQTTRIDKINYLTTCLPDLFIEIIPYELCSQPCIRLRDFIDLLSSLGIDLKNEVERCAADTLIRMAHQLRMPAFERIYFAVFQEKFNLVPSRKFAALGMFRELEDLINQFALANSYQVASKTANDLLTLYGSLKDLFHFVSAESASNYTKNFQIKYKRLPSRSERFFVSDLGRYITFRLVNPNSRLLAYWNEHLHWIGQHKDAAIAKAMFIIGFNNVSKVWDGINPLDIYAFIEQKIEPLLYMQRPHCAGYGYEYYSDILQHISAKHVLDASMFDAGLDFESAFKRFYDKNIFALIAPGLDDKVNINNPTIAYLLQRFTQIALTGTEVEKLVVKSFFLGRQDSRDLLNLTKALGRLSSGHMKSSSPYYQFIIRQQHEYQPFTLFTQQEKLASIDYLHWRYNCVSPLDYIDIYALNYSNLTLECLAELIGIMLVDLEKHPETHSSIVTLLDYYVSNLGRVALFQPASIRLLKLHHADHYVTGVALIPNLLRNFIWTLPASLEQLPNIPLLDLALVYRTYESSFAFPSTAEQERFEKLLLDKINSLADAEAKLGALEMLLLEQPQFILVPLTQVQVVNALIRLWIDTIYHQYGKDDGTPAFNANLKPIIDRVCKSITKRDVITLMSGLANKLELQAELSVYIGAKVNPHKFLLINNRNYHASALGILGQVSSIIKKDRNDLYAFLDFIANPLTAISIEKFSRYLIARDKQKHFIEAVCPNLHDTKSLEKVDFKKALMIIHNLFWDRPLEERCVIIDYALIPTSKVINEHVYKQAYDEAFIYIAKKLFKQAANKGSDDEFALAFLSSYLNAADKYQRSLLLSGLLVASNKIHSDQEEPNIAKILANLCEFMGPAYVKFAQAIHSHPDTPDHIRCEFNHIKGRANPPYRWDLFRLMMTVLPKAVLDDIASVEQLIGSASYNLAVIVKRKSTGKRMVLSLLRENAHEDALKGFKHLKIAIENCDHPRLDGMRSALLSMLTEAAFMSEIEMDHEASKVQYAFADQINRQRQIVNGYIVNIFPCQLIEVGKGYRMIELIAGVEFNDLPCLSDDERQIKTIAAKAIYTMELGHILSGKKFDSDRHGNQLRVNVHAETKIMAIGLYDFGEMALEDPVANEIKQLAAVFETIPALLVKKMSFMETLDTALSEQINLSAENNISSRYLMRVRKGLLALQDYQKQLTNVEVMEIVLSVIQADSTHPLLKNSLKKCSDLLSAAQGFYRTKNAFFAMMNEAWVETQKVISHIL